MPKHILYAVLNWGLGHATRSIPVINALLAKGFTVTVASDGLALDFLKNHFPGLPFIALPPLDVKYSASSKQTIALFADSSRYVSWYRKERNFMQQHLAANTYDGIISDNRPTIFSKGTHNIYLTHQVNIKAGLFSNPVSRAHQKFMAHFSEIWIPDYAEKPWLSGELGHGQVNGKSSFIGPLSDLHPQKINTFEFDLAVILSGPEPQRTLLERAVTKQLETKHKSVILFRGSNSPPQESIPPHWQVSNVASREAVQSAFEKSRVIIARCGYSTLMDLDGWEKAALLIPTPGQPEQEYLASLPIHKNRYAIQKQAQLHVPKGIELALRLAKKDLRHNYLPDWESLLSVF